MPLGDLIGELLSSVFAFLFGFSAGTSLFKSARQASRRSQTYAAGGDVFIPYWFTREVSGGRTRKGSGSVQAGRWSKTVIRG